MADKCSNCGAPVISAMTESGKRFPVEPAPAGGWVLVPGPLEVPIAKRYSWSLDEPVPPVLVRAEGRYTLFQPHFVTCPNSERHRKKKR